MLGLTIKATNGKCNVFPFVEMELLSIMVLKVRKKSVMIKIMIPVMVASIAGYQTTINAQGSLLSAKIGAGMGYLSHILENNAIMVPLLKSMAVPMTVR